MQSMQSIQSQPVQPPTQPGKKNTTGREDPQHSRKNSIGGSKNNNLKNDLVKSNSVNKNFIGRQPQPMNNNLVGSSTRNQSRKPMVPEPVKN